MIGCSIDGLAEHAEGVIVQRGYAHNFWMLQDHKQSTDDALGEKHIQSVDRVLLQALAKITSQVQTASVQCMC
jgi:hypothetical protein